MSITLRPLQLPEDYTGLAELLNTEWAEPTTAEQLAEDDAKLYEVGYTYKDELGLLAGYDRTRYVAVNERNEILGYVNCWRAPWTEPGQLVNLMVVAEQHRRQGIGQKLLDLALEWGRQLGASTLVAQVWDDKPDSLNFAAHRGFEQERHIFQSVLDIAKVDWENLDEKSVILSLEQSGLRFTTLAEEPGEVSEQKLYELYKETAFDIPGYTGDFPVIEEWRKWHLMVDGYAPEQVIIAADGDKYVGVSNVLHNQQTNGMYHEYTGVSRAYRGRKVGLGLKLKAIQLARRVRADYIRTDNDSTNAPILKINRRLGYAPLRGSYRMLGRPF
ncbi:GNAT family N-acetyltransferase [Paenibacillus sp. NPDC056722]|uniref:GNAT family N-acetyltransferase n=1 Tax=Paenibacillus sp. NPDC056722 TaxID=3345924 RepID=UPI0036BB9F48